ncbi:iron-containing redox enzyme family protein, partial [Thalassotalea sp. G20_0]
DEWLAELLKQPEQVWQSLHANFGFRHQLYAYGKQLCDIAQKLQNPDDAESKQAALTEIHRTLELIYNQDFVVPSYENLNTDTQPLIRDLAAQLEAAMLSAEHTLIDLELINAYPKNGAEYVKWLQRLISQHPSSVHSVYNEYLSNHAGPDELAYYFAQETTLDPRFDDILALMQIGNQVDVKLEIAQNYWDEMGNGNLHEVHSRLFAQALNDLSIT